MFSSTNVKVELEDILYCAKPLMANKAISMRSPCLLTIRNWTVKHEVKTKLVWAYTSKDSRKRLRTVWSYRPRGYNEFSPCLSIWRTERINKFCYNSHEEIESYLIFIYIWVNFWTFCSALLFLPSLTAECFNY